MAENVTINGTTYNGVTGIAIKTADGRTVLFEVSPVKTVNGIAPDQNGNINITPTEADLNMIAGRVLEMLGGTPVAGYFDENNDIVFTSALPDGVYTVKIGTADGFQVIGSLDKTSAKTYTVRWCNYDGTILETDTVTEGETPVYNGSTPTKAEDDQYTYTFKDWDKTVVAATADATYTATYTQTAKPTEPTVKNLADYNSEDWLDGYRLSTTTAGSTSTNTGQTTTNFIPCKSGDTLYIKGMCVTEMVNSKDCAICTYDKDKKALNVSIFSRLGSSSSQGAKNYVTVNGDVSSYQVMIRGSSGENGATSATEYVRFTGAYLSDYGNDENKKKVVITVNQPIE